MYHAIKHLFPGILDAEFAVQDDGHGPFIARWDRPEPPPTPEQIEAAYPAVRAKQLEQAVTHAVQQRLDAFAQTRNYDGILSAATYASSTVAKFAAEGQYAVNARDAHWAKCYEILAQVQAGTRPIPTLDEVMAEMPPLEWPPEPAE